MKSNNSDRKTHSPKETTKLRIENHGINVGTNSNDENCPNGSRLSSTNFYHYSNKTRRLMFPTNERQNKEPRHSCYKLPPPLDRKQCNKDRRNNLIDEYSNSLSNSVIATVAGRNTPSKSRPSLPSSGEIDGGGATENTKPPLAAALVAGAVVVRVERSAPASSSQRRMNPIDDCATEKRRRLLLQERQRHRQAQQPPHHSRLFTELDAGHTNADPTSTKNEDDGPTKAQSITPPPPSSSSYRCYQRNNFHCFLVFNSHCILLLLALFEVQDYYNLFQLGTVFDFISIMTEWMDVLHVGFVLAFGIRGLISAWNISTTKEKRSRKQQTHNDRARKKNMLNSKDCEKSRLLSQLQSLLHFLVVASFWLSLLPMFKDCNRGSDSNHSRNNKLCFFIERRVVAAMKGRIPRHIIFHVSSPRYSALEHIVKFLYKKTKLILKSKIQGRLMREILLAVLSPLAFRGRMRKLFKIIRWANFLAPLFGTCNKFRGHLLDMIQRRRLHSSSKTARKLWNDVIDAYCQQSRLDRAVRILQRRYLERRKYKVQRRYALMAPHRESSNLKIACAIRRRLVEEERLSRSRLDKMTILDSQRKLRSQVSLEERCSWMQQRDFERKLKRRLLLSPKTTFAVGWKYCALACVALEISSLVFAPMVLGEIKKMSLYEFLVRVLKASMPKCGDKDKKVAAPSMFVPVAIGNSLGGGLCIPSSWEQKWFMTVHIFATLIVPMVNTIFFLDVFITFFTGGLTSSGTLVPKPLFERFIFPGIGLQLLVNPTMTSISRIVKQTISHATLVGPSLFFHLLLACVPFVAYCYDRVLDLVFDFVERQNSRR